MCFFMVKFYLINLESMNFVFIIVLECIILYKYVNFNNK